MDYALKTIWFWKFPTGGFANATFVYLFAKYVEKVLGCKIILGDKNTPHSILVDIYDLPNYYKDLDLIEKKLLNQKIVLSSNRRDTPKNDLEKIKSQFLNYSGDILPVDGYFQYDTNHLKNDEKYMSIFNSFLSLQYENSTFQKQIRNYQRIVNTVFKDKYLITIHVRRGDYLNFEILNNWGGDIFYTLNLNNVISDLNEYIEYNKISNSIIYIASDDHVHCRQYFTTKGINYISAEDIIGIKDKNDINLLLTDIASITTAHLVVASNSSLSILSSLLNEKSHVFWRQTKNGKTISFDPWATPILYGL